MAGTRNVAVTEKDTSPRLPGTREGAPTRRINKTSSVLASGKFYGDKSVG